MIIAVHDSKRIQTICHNVNSPPLKQGYECIPHASGSVLHRTQISVIVGMVLDPCLANHYLWDLRSIAKFAHHLHGGVQHGQLPACSGVIPNRHVLTNGHVLSLLTPTLFYNCKFIFDIYVRWN